VESFLTDVLPIAASVVLALCVIGGVIGSALPAIPGASIIWLGVVLHGVMTGWQPLGLWIQVSIMVLALLAMGCQFVVTALGAKKTGASMWGALGALVGLMVGMLVPIPILGPLAGAFGGALLAEHVATGKQGEEALLAGAGAVAGALIGAMAEFVIALVMTAVILLAFLR
jgi:uncharacterized protein YqgC (DUF456 family)